MNKLTAGLWSIMDELEHKSTLVCGEIDEIRESLLDAIEKIESALDAERWVSVKERLPDDCDEVYAHIVDKFTSVEPFEAVMYEDAGRWHHAHGPLLTSEFAVTHWRPLPQFEVGNAKQ